MKRRELTEIEREEAERLSRAWLDYKATHKGVTQEWLAAESGLGTQGAVGQYLRGVIPLNVEALMAVCRVLEVDPKTISERLTSIVSDVVPVYAGLPVAEMRNVMQVRASYEDDPEFIQIPMVRLRLSAGVTGFQTEPDRRDDGTMSIPVVWLQRKGYVASALVAIQVSGESMEPALYDRDVVVIDTADKKLIDGVVFAFNYEGEAVVKRVSRDAGDWWLTSDNPDQRKYHRKLCRGAACIVIGRVVRREGERI